MTVTGRLGLLLTGEEVIFGIVSLLLSNYVARFSIQMIIEAD
jgi:hypothetical protein